MEVARAAPALEGRAAEVRDERRRVPVAALLGHRVHGPDADPVGRGRAVPVIATVRPPTSQDQ